MSYDWAAIATGLGSFIVSYKALVPAFFAVPEGSFVPPREPGILGALTQHVNLIRKAENGHLYQRWSKMNGDKPFYFFMTYLTCRLLVQDPRDLEYLLVKNPEALVKSPQYRLLEPLLGKDNLVTIRDEAYHTDMRRVVSPAFSPAALRAIADTTVRAHADAFAKELAAAAASNGKIDDIAERLGSAALSIVTEAAFRADSKGTKKISDSFLAMTATAGVNLLMFLPFSELFPTQKNRAMWRAQRLLADFASKAVADCRAGGRATDGSGKSLVDYLAFDLKQSSVKDNCVTFLFAGHETTATALTWLSYALAVHPEVQTRLYEELASAMTLSTIPPVEELRKLPYLQAVVKETLRLWPPAPNVGRLCTRDEVLPTGTFVPQGTMILLSPFVTNRLERVWGADADSFRPERWEDSTLEERLGPCGFMPFLVGKRNCIGKEFAMNEMAMLTAVMVRRFKIDWVEGQDTPRRLWSMTTTMKPTKPFSLTITPHTE